MKRMIDEKDYEKYKYSYLFSYLCFLIPLVFVSNSKLGKYYANQGLVLFLFNLLVISLNKVIGLIPVFGLLVVIILKFSVYIVLIYAMYCVCIRKVWRIPIIGRVNIIKNN